jgi:hypothetical protein
MIRRQPLAVFGLALLLSVTSAATSLPPKECGTLASPRGQSYEIGLVYAAIIPSGLPDLTRTIPVYGPVLGFPILGGTVQLQSVWGTDRDTNLSLMLIETNYRLEIEIPFFHVFGLFGAHYLRYSQTTEHSGFGANLGIGLAFLMGKNFELSFSLRTYLQQRSTVSFGGQFAFLL